MSRGKHGIALLGVVLFLAAGAPLAAQAPEVTFLFAQRAEAGNKPVGAVIAHFNTDGVLDLAVGNANSSDVSLLFGNADGTFQLPFQQPVGATVVALQGGDLDGNGWVDLVVLTSSSVRIFRNDGVAPLLTRQDTNLGFSGALAVRVGLINGDAVPDLAVVNNTSFQILLGDGTGLFAAQAAVSLAITIAPDTLALGNLDNDVGSATDMVVHGRNGSNNGEVDVVLGNGDGTFQLPTLTRRRVVESPYDSTGGDIVVADFNGNGRADVASLRATGQSYILLGAGEPTTPLLPPVALAATGKHVAVTDLNGDTLPDLAIAQDKLNDIAVMLGNGDGTFTEAEGFATGAAPVGVQIGDLDADTEKDFAAPTGASVYSARGTGGGAFQAARNVFVLGAPGGAVSADFNNDGRNDLAVANRDGNEAVIFLFQAGDRPGTPSRIALGTSPVAMASGDFNHDGAVDLVTAHPASTDIAVLLGNGNGTFAPATRFFLPATPESSLAVGDFNNDANPDIAVAQIDCFPCNPRVSVLLGDGAGGFQLSPVSLIGSADTVTGLAAADFDRDGKLDLVASIEPCCDNVTIRVLRGRGDGQFDTGVTVQSETSKNLGGLVVGEFNGDGLPDFAYAVRPNFSPTNGLLRVLHGQGNLTFVAGLTRTLPLPPHALLADDVNGDGADDLVVSEILSGTISLGTLALILGNGDGTFRDDALLPGLGGDPKKLIQGDLNNDGKCDIITLNDTGKNATLLLNNTPNPVPTLTALSPSATPPGSPDFTLTLVGSRFVAASVVRWNGVDRVTTFVSNTRLQATIPAADVAGPGTASVTVFSPTPAGGASAPLTFNISSDNPLPVLSSISPGSALAGGAAFTLNLAGLDFASGSVVRWNGSDRPTTFLTHQTLQAAVPAGDLPTGGVFPVTVFNPGPGGGASNFRNFTVFNLAPTLTSISPAGTRPGAADFTLTLTGTKFVSTSVVRWNGVNRSTVFINATTLQATIPAADVALQGTASVTVFNPTPGGGTSSAQIFTIDPFWPVNDNFADATVITTTPFTDTVNTTVASTETTDPTPSCISFRAKSVWYQFTPASNGTLRGDTIGSNYWTALSAWTGAPGSFVSVGCSQSSGGNAQLTLAVTAGTTYSFMVSSSFSGGSLVFNLSLGPTLTSLSPASTLAGGAGFTLTVNGSGFIPTSVVRWNAADRTTTFVNSTQLTADISAADIATGAAIPVTVFNPGAGLSNTLTFNVNNPVPTLTSLSPPNALPGGPAFTLTVNGTNFVSTSTVRWKFSSRPTTFINSTQLTADISAADIASAGTAFVDVTNPLPGGGSSNVLTFNISGPPPPNDDFAGAIVVGTTPFTDAQDTTAATIEGTDPSPSCSFNNKDRSVWYQYTPATNGLVTADTFTSNYDTVLSAYTGSPGSFVSRACNDQSGGNQSQISFSVVGGTTYSFMVSDFNTTGGALVFHLDFQEVANPAPALTTLSPSTKTAGGAAFTLTVNGSNFVGNSVVRWNDSDRTTAFVSSAQVTADIPAGDIALAGTGNVTVFNPAPGGGLSNVLTLPINNPSASTTSLSPSSTTAGGAGFTLTVNGSGFVPVSVVRWNGSDRTTTYVSSAQVTADIPAGDIALAGTASVTVFNPSPGGGTSSPRTFTINNPVPTVSSLSPTNANAGGAAFTLTVNGSNFVSGSVVRWNGANRTTTFVNSTQLTASISASDIANAGSALVTVFNATPGGGTSTALTFTISSPPNATFRGSAKDANKVLQSGVTVGAYQAGVLKFSATSGSDGRYVLAVNAGTYDLVASKPGFLNTTKAGMSIAANQTLSKVGFKLFRPSFFQGTVTRADTGAPLDAVLVEALKNGVVRASTLTAPDGSYSLQVTKGTYTLRFTKAGFKTRQKKDQTIGDGVTKTVNVTLALP